MRKKLLALLTALVLTAQLAGCSTQTAGPVGDESQDSIKDKFNSARAEQKDAEETTAAQDTTVPDAREQGGDEEDAGVRYQDDYYEYVNENLLSKIELAATDAHWDWFGELNAVVSAEMEDIIDDLANDKKTYEKGSSEQKIKDMYECVTDMENREETGLGPLKPHMDSIRNASSIDEYVDALAHLSGEFGFSSIVGGYNIMQDKADSSEYAV